MRPLLPLLVAAVLPWWGLALEVTQHPEGSPAYHTGRGLEALAMGQYQAAITHQQAALQKDHRYFPALYNLALTYQRMQQWEQARRWYEEALLSRPDHPETLSNLGIIAFQLGDYAAAAARFESAAQIAISRGGGEAARLEVADYYYNLGTAYERMENWRSAITAYQNALEHHPGHFSVLYNLGTLHLRLNQPGEAQTLLERAVQADPTRPEPLLNLAVLAERLGRSTAAELYNQAVDVALRSNPETLPDVLWRRARYLDRQFKKVEMRQDLEEILRRRPEYPGANGLLGMYHEALGETVTAITYLEREVAADAFDPTNEIDVECLYLLARIFSSSAYHDPARALQYATAYFRQRPDSAKARDLRQRTLQTGGNR